MYHITLCTLLFLCMFTEYSLCASFLPDLVSSTAVYLCVHARVCVPCGVLYSAAYSISLPALGTQPDRSILSLSEEISLSCVLPLMKVCHILEVHPFDVV